MPVVLARAVPRVPGIVNQDVSLAEELMLKVVEVALPGPPLEDTRMPGPPPRSATSPGYVADANLRTWAPFTYAAPGVRRMAARDFRLNLTQQLPPLPPLRVVLIGGVAAGKGTIAPMLSQAFRVRTIGIGALLRGEARAERPRALAASRAMAAGELLPDELVLQVLNERVGGGTDAARNGWLLDGFPRTAEQVHARATVDIPNYMPLIPPLPAAPPPSPQRSSRHPPCTPFGQAEALVNSESWADLRPDVVVLIERPEELVREFALGRCSDGATGQTYHPIYAPPPAEIQERLVWRVDDTHEALDRRISDHQSSIEAILQTFLAAGVPLRRFDNARSEIETFGEVANFLGEVAMDKLVYSRENLESGLTFDEVADTLQPSPSDPADVAPYCLLDESEEECLARFQDEQRLSLAPDVDVFCNPDEPDAECVVRYQEEQQVGALLAAVQRCNSYELGDFTPLLVDEEQVGWLNPTALEALETQLALGRACERIEATQLSGAAAAAARRATGGVAVRIAPGATGPEARSEFVAALVGELVADGVIPRSKLRNELQDVHPFSRGFVVAGLGVQPALRMERAAMIYFGVPSYGVHVNGWVRDPDDPSSEVPWAMWVATRSMSKATYPGLLDQMVAGGQPTAISFDENVQKECEEEASLPPEVIASIVPAGSVSYRYATPKGLSTKVLMTYDLEMPHGLQPLCSDGEVEEFRLQRVDEVLRSLREDLPLWKPNSALIAVDFCVRHGLVDETEPGYEELVRLLDQKVF